MIAHGTQYGNAMLECVAVEFPETTFAWATAIDTGADKGLSNVFAYEAQAQEGGYVNGVIAALMGDSNTIGVVDPVEAGNAKLYIDGFVEGVKATKPDMQVDVGSTGSFGDTTLAAEAANTHIKAGAKVLTGSAQQVVGAIGVAAQITASTGWARMRQKPAGAEVGRGRSTVRLDGRHREYDRQPRTRHGGRHGVFADAKRQVWSFNSTIKPQSQTR